LTQSRKRDRDEAVAYSTTIPLTNRAVSNIGRTFTGRIVEVYNATIIAEYYGTWLADSMLSLQEHEADNFTNIPNISDSVFEMTAHGPVMLGNLFATTTQSAIFTLRSDSGKLIKYQSNCAELDFEKELFVKPYLHPSIVDFAFTRRAAKYGLAPKMHQLSAPVSLCKSTEGKCKFNISGEQYEVCRNDPNSSLRYTVVDRVRGESLYEYAERFDRSVIPFTQAMTIGVNLIDLIEKLHTEARIGHGDIHESNIMVSWDTGNLTLIDFARAFALVKRTTMQIRSPFWSTHALFSYREILGYTPTAIDDVLRAVETIARLMIPGSDYLEYLREITDRDPIEILDWKFRRNIFRIPSEVGTLSILNDPIRNLGLDSNTTSLIESTLLNVLNVTRNWKQGEPIPYTIIREAFNECYRLATL
jgi:hypothetical protein